MAQSKCSTAKPISIRYTCAPNERPGWGLSHYLISQAPRRLNRHQLGSFASVGPAGVPG